MKKVLATILALVMAIGVTTAAWAGTTENCAGGESCAHQAAIGNTHYDTLKEAIEAVHVNDTTPTEIVLLKDVDNGDGIVVASGKNFTLDFAGHTYTITQKVVGSTGTESQCFQLLKDSTITMKDGAIVANCTGALMIIQNYCNLTLDNMKLDATAGNNNVGYVVSNNCGNVVIKNGTTITAKTTGVAFDVYGGFGDYSDVSVTLEAGATVNGKVEVARDTGTQNVNTLTVTGGTVNGELDVDANEKTTVAVSGGTFSTDVSSYVTTAPVAKRTNGSYIVGASAIVAAANADGAITIVKSNDVALEGINSNVTVSAGANAGVVKVNGNTVTAGTSYTVPARYYYNSPTTTTGTKADGPKGSPKTFDAGVGIYAVSAILSVTGMAYVGKKKF